METSVVYGMDAGEYNKKLAEALKKNEHFVQPEWSLYVKSGVSKKLPPLTANFWHARAASILRQIYVQKVVGVNRLKTRYGSKQNRGMKPEIFKRASGKMIRVMLQQAEAAGLIEKTKERGKKAGRQLTVAGKQLMERIQ